MVAVENNPFALSLDRIGCSAFLIHTYILTPIDPNKPKVNLGREICKKWKKNLELWEFGIKKGYFFCESGRKELKICYFWEYVVYYDYVKL